MHVHKRIRNYSIALLLVIIAMVGIQARWFVHTVLSDEKVIHDQINTAICSAFVYITAEDSTRIRASKCANFGGGEFALETESELSGLDSLIRKELGRIDEIEVPFKVTVATQEAPRSLHSELGDRTSYSNAYQMAHVNLALPTRVHFFVDQVNRGIVVYSVLVCLTGLVFLNVFKSIRHLQAIEYPASNQQRAVYQVGRYTLDCKNQELGIDREMRRITEKESRLLGLLCSNKNQLVRRDEILTVLWGENDYFKGRSLDVFVGRLRKYLSRDKNVSIETVYGVGFVLREE